MQSQKLEDLSKRISVDQYLDIQHSDAPAPSNVRKLWGQYVQSGTEEVVQALEAALEAYLDGFLQDAAGMRVCPSCGRPWNGVPR